jgi:hypothetical protein
MAIQPIRWLQIQELSDVIIKFGSKEVFAHKAILVNGSVWFERALLGRFSVRCSFSSAHGLRWSTIQEANEKIIELHDDASPTATMAMLRHLYGSNYANQSIGDEHHLTAELHSSVFMLGDKYDISSLRVDAAERFRDFLKLEVRSSCFYDRTIHVIQKVLGPSALQLADQALTQSTADFVLQHRFRMMRNAEFRSLLAEGLMLEKVLAVKFLEGFKNLCWNRDGRLVQAQPSGDQFWTSKSPR